MITIKKVTAFKCGENKTILSDYEVGSIEAIEELRKLYSALGYTKIRFIYEDKCE